MIPVTFQEANKVFAPPPGVPESECGRLPVYSDGHSITSVWRLSDDELELIVKTRAIVHTVQSGDLLHPLSLAVALEPIAFEPVDPGEPEIDTTPKDS